MKIQIRTYVKKSKIRAKAQTLNQVHSIIYRLNQEPNAGKMEK